ncbi:MAG: stage III sporulation protein AC [Clostridia bacterium]
MSVDIIFKIAVIGIIVAIISSVLKRAERDDIANLVSLAGVIIVLLMIIDLVVKLFDTIKGLLLL